MAQVGTITEQTRSPELLVGTWTIAATAAAADNSTPVDFRGYDFVEFYISLNTGYSSGTHTIGVAIETDGDGSIIDNAGRALRASRSSATVNSTGFVQSPPPQLHFIVTAVATGPVTATTVRFIARAASVKRVRE